MYSKVYNSNLKNRILLGINIDVDQGIDVVDNMLACIATFIKTYCYVFIKTYRYVLLLYSIKTLHISLHNSLYLWASIHS